MCFKYHSLGDFLKMDTFLNTNVQEAVTVTTYTNDNK